jgi:3-oxoadipate enol-lactonase
MKFYPEDTIFLEYNYLAKAGKPCLLFLNGLTQSFDAWNNTIAHLEKKFEILLVDLINQGNSSKTEREIDFNEHAAIIHKLIKHLKINEVWIVGISYGSIVAQHYANLFPLSLKGLVLISSFAKKNNYYRAIEVAWKNSIEQMGYKYFLQTIFPFVLGKTYFEGAEFSIEKILSERLSKPFNEKSLKLLMKATEERKDFSEELKSVKAPVLILHGEEDTLFTVEMAQYLAQTIPQSLLKILPQTGHSINVEQPFLLARLVEEFIETKTT